MLRRGFSKATDVVVGGGSAGGLATFLHVDWWASMAPKVSPSHSDRLGTLIFAPSPFSH